MLQAFTFFGMAMMNLMPTVPLATNGAAFFMLLWNLYCGFLLFKDVSGSGSGSGSDAGLAGPWTSGMPGGEGGAKGGRCPRCRWPVLRLPAVQGCESKK